MRAAWPRDWHRWPTIRSRSIRARCRAALVRLEQKGWIRGTWQRSENNREARVRTAIERPGARALERLGRALARLAGLVDKLLMSEG